MLKTKTVAQLTKELPESNIKPPTTFGLEMYHVDTCRSLEQIITGCVYISHYPSSRKVLMGQFLKGCKLLTKYWESSRGHMLIHHYLKWRQGQQLIATSSPVSEGFMLFYSPPYPILLCWPLLWCFLLVKQISLSFTNLPTPNSSCILLKKRDLCLNCLSTGPSPLYSIHVTNQKF